MFNCIFNILTKWLDKDFDFEFELEEKNPYQKELDTLYKQIIDNERKFIMPSYLSKWVKKYL